MCLEREVQPAHHHALKYGHFTRRYRSLKCWIYCYITLHSGVHYIPNGELERSWPQNILDLEDCMYTSSPDATVLVEGYRRWYNAGSMVMTVASLPMVLLVATLPTGSVIVPALGLLADTSPLTLSFLML